jgi:uncharacterized RDD family membrane protein YckC
MKCPKCGYLGFERVERCRNCGYDFSFAQADDLPEFPLREQPSTLQAPGDLDDLVLVDAAAPGPTSLAHEGQVAGREAPSRPAAPPPAGDLPLFGGATDDVPLITRASPPRPPLAVRRATPELSRLPSEARRPSTTSMLDLPELGGAGEPDGLNGRDVFTAAARRPVSDRWPADVAGTGAQPAALLTRMVATSIDLVLLAVIDLLVIYFTMKICGLTLADLDILPKAPLAAFLLVQNGGYLVALTAGGQTLGKMAASIKVVGVLDDAPLDMGRSLVRTLVWAALAIPAGLGFLTILLNSDRRGLHDRCAGTRVIRVSL